ncbi:hypothetical protein EJ070_28585 [Mesorhizobium sp. M1E.F.Ca.ET.045.02.1.1]|uniref:hypothetical protein n=1 Tax=unclassified Mesorhizobium TaxID=325217 RepID=UPI000F75DAAE|nr:MULTISPECIES: hypothetical protein [unclassified Mesorhizobium]AZO24257.1 hypothetical protein EJ070_28585 [Mesorhizobium sp. M1E.F.Ca.ET.045.02.1.1]RUW71426.1 hypothetical protein EOA29_34660 [Mesorhizobium sp. M1E.F.Ca.ET.063.01.1.1]TKB21957.1 MAG: hypothetical protein E5V75_02245 [Mesorhizobium sp.]
MDINPTRLTSLLKEALTPQPVPSARPDPATAALVKALVQPPAPSTVQSAQFAAQTLNGSLAKLPAQSPQRLSSVEIENAYRAVMEPDVGTDDASARASAHRPAADADQPPRAIAQAQAAAAGSSQIAAVPLPSSFSPTIASGVLFAANTNAPPRGGGRPGHAPRSEPGQTPLWMISIVTAIVSAATTTIVLLLLR